MGAETRRRKSKEMADKIVALLRGRTGAGAGLVLAVMEAVPLIVAALTTQQTGVTAG
jgi:hypothetical protein